MSTAPTRATLADVARRAGVSTSTASLAFSGSGPVAAATRAKVLAAAEEMGYAGPDPRGRSLRSGRTGVVAVVVGERLGYAFRDPMMVSLMDALADELSPLGSSLLLVTATDGTPAAGHAPLADRLAAVPLDGVVFATCGPHVEPAVTGMLRRHLPLVTIDRRSDDDIAAVTVDDAGGVRACLDHLAALGHERIGVLTLPMAVDDGAGAPPQPRVVPQSEIDTLLATGGAGSVGEGGIPLLRLLAAAEHARTLRTADGKPVRLTVVECARNLSEAGGEGTRLLLGRQGPDAVTAVAAQSDVLAVGCLSAAEGLGLAVPARLSVTGFDGIEPHVLGSPLELTTAVQPVREKGRAAGRRLASLLAGQDADSVDLPVELRVGASTGPAPA
ncbi:MAG: substrate-binding domain-containing protein [Kineosporiaceae bacterium]